MTNAATELSARWAGVLAVEGSLTGDGRLIEPGALRWGDLPLKLRYVKEDSGEHANAVVVGLITNVERRGAQIWGEGTIDRGSPEGQEVYRLMGGDSEGAEPLVDGISIDLDDVSFEIRVKQEIIAEQEAFMEAVLSEDPDAPLPESPPKVIDQDGRVTVMEAKIDDEVMVTTDARIRAATLVAVPAFIEARITLVKDTTQDSTDTQDAEELADDEELADEETGTTTTTTTISGEEDDDELTAAAAPVRPPAAWFDNPRLTGPTPLTITDDGHIYGHLAAWDTCHTSHPGECVSPPSSPSSYAYFRTGTVLTREGTEVPAGRVTMDTGHANPKLKHLAAMAHYDNTGAAVADIAVGEDEFGIWVTGALRPNVTEQQARVLRGSPLSGDWRRIGGSLELVAALAVNVPGFPIPHPAGLVASGHMEALVASGMVLSGTLSKDEYHANSVTPKELARIRRMIDLDREREAKGFARRVNMIKVSAMARKLGRI